MVLIIGIHESHERPRIHQDHREPVGSLSEQQTDGPLPPSVFGFRRGQLQSNPKPFHKAIRLVPVLRSMSRSPGESPPTRTLACGAQCGRYAAWFPYSPVDPMIALPYDRRHFDVALRITVYLPGVCRRFKLTFIT